MLSCALAEYEQVGQGVPAEPVGAMQAGRDLSRGEQPGNGGHLRVTVDPHASHDVVGGRTDFHREWS
jgi:hypothetical protein